jgi:Tfp pilus assembly protein PilN
VSKLHNVYDKKINFVPEIILNTRARRIKIGASTLGIATLLVVLLWPVIYLNEYNHDSVEKIITLQEMYNNYKVQADDVRLLARETEDILGKKALLDQVAKNARIWGPVLQVVSDSVPGEMWFYSFTLTPYVDSADGASVNEKNSPALTTPSATNSSTSENSQSPAAIAEDKQLPEGDKSIITIRGGAKAVDAVGKFMYKINTLYNFGRVDLKSITRSEESNTIDFELQVVLEEEVGRGA